MQSELPAELAPSFVLGAGPQLPEEAYLYRPNSVDIDEQGNIFVLDAGNQRVVVFNARGEFVREFGRSGQGPGEFFLGADMLDEIVVTDDRVFVMEKQRFRIQGLSKFGEPLSSFTLPDVIWKIDVDDGLIYISLKQNVRGSPLVAVYKPDGELVKSLGSSVFSRDDRRVDRLNMHHAEVGHSGEVRTAFEFLPLLEELDPAPGAAQHWYDFSWWDRGELRVWATLDNGPEVYRRLRDGDVTGTVPRRVVFWDLEFAPGTSEWWTIMYHGIAQSFSDAGDPRRSFLLLPGSNEDPEVLVDPQDIGVNRQGTVLCAADRKESVVRCYDLPLQ
jgi:hypothetical protein